MAPALVVIEDGDTTWRFDSTFLTSNWTCLWGRGCLGILAEPAPELGQGCCSVGAEPGDADARVQHDIGRHLCGQPRDSLGTLEHGAVECGTGALGGLAVGERDRADSVCARELDELAIGAAGSERDDLDVRESLDDIEGLAADRACRSEQGEALHEISG